VLYFKQIFITEFFLKKSKDDCRERNTMKKDAKEGKNASWKKLAHFEHLLILPPLSVSKRPNTTLQNQTRN